MGLKDTLKHRAQGRSLVLSSVGYIKDYFSLLQGQYCFFSNLITLGITPLAVGRIYNRKRQEAAPEYRDEIIHILVWQLNCYPKNTGAWDLIRFALEKY